MKNIFLRKFEELVLDEFEKRLFSGVANFNCCSQKLFEVGGIINMLLANLFESGYMYLVSNWGERKDNSSIFNNKI